MTTARWTNCARCKEPFALFPETETTLRRSQATFYCPFGHAQSFCPGESEEDKLRRERDRLKQQTAQLRDEVIHEAERREYAERRASAARGQVTRLKNRAAAGLCPCCNRSFANLSTHMTKQHPTFRAEPIAGDEVVH